MNKFCGKCGASVPEHAGFCGACGASAQPAASPSSQPAVQPVPQPTASPAAPAATAAKASSPWIKVAIVAVVLIFVGGALALGGAIYLAHRVCQKAHEYSRAVLGETSPTLASVAAEKPRDAASPANKSAAGAEDACRLLSKEDVSRAIGVTILETSPTDGGCSYLAKGTSADMTAKHTAAMLGAKGADKKTQGMIEQFAGAIGNNMPKNATDDTQSADGNAVVLTFGIDANAAEEQMRLNSKVLGMNGMGNVDAIDGIGDEAFSKSDSMMFVRKGDKLIRIMYMSCPCSTDAIKPLAKEIVAHL